MALNFPIAPAQNDFHTDEGRLYQWITDRWIIVGDSEGVVTTIVDAASGSNGWQIWGDTLIQWGTATPSGGVAKLVTFTKAFQTTPRVQATVRFQQGADTTTRVASVYDVVPTSFWTETRIIQTATSISNSPFDWIAIGEALDADKLAKEIDMVGGSGGGGGGASITVGDTFPPTPDAGALHYSTDEEVGLYLYYEDVDSSQWIQTNGAMGNTGSVTIVEDVYPENTIAGYQVIGDLLHQWNYEPNVNATVDTATFPIAFAAPPTVIVGCQSANRSCNAQNVTTTTFEWRAWAITNGTEVGANIFYYAVGLAPESMRKPKEIGTVGGALLQEYHDPAGLSSWRIVGNTLECWGSDKPASGGTLIISFPKTFADTPVVVGSIDETGFVAGGRQSTVTVSDKSTTQYTANIRTQVDAGNPVVSNLDFNWHATGQWDGVS